MTTLYHDFPRLEEITAVGNISYSSCACGALVMEADTEAWEASFELMPDGSTDLRLAWPKGDWSACDGPMGDLLRGIFLRHMSEWLDSCNQALAATRRVGARQLESAVAVGAVKPSGPQDGQPPLSEWERQALMGPHGSIPWVV